MSRKQEPDQDIRKGCFFLIALGLLGILVSWPTSLDTFMPSIPGLGVRTTGTVISYKDVWPSDSYSADQASVVQFTDKHGLPHTVIGSPALILHATIDVLYWEQAPEHAYVVDSPYRPAFNLFFAPCITLPCIALVLLGIYLWVAFGKPPVKPSISPPGL